MLETVAHFQVVLRIVPGDPYLGLWGVCVSSPFDISKELGIIKSVTSWGCWGWKAGRHWKASRVHKQIEQQYDPETAEAVAAAIGSGRNPQRILERAERRKAEGAERDKLLTSPPPLHGSAAALPLATSLKLQNILSE